MNAVPEIINDLGVNNLPDFFMTVISGSLNGLGKAFQKIIGIEPKNSPIISQEKRYT